ncbi:MAG: response regulator transcription factor [Lautropia sp.]|nr:response regulator transcription factor [Lautropia sp.]
MTRILFVDDDVELARLLAEYVQQEGFETCLAHDGEQGIAEALSGRHALVVLDMMMPGINGIEVLRRIRLASSLPVLMLTARGDDIDRVVGLEMGADDYVPKPCTPRELMARIRAILRRTGGTMPPAGASSEEAAPEVVEAGALQLWPGRRRASWHGAPLALTSTQFNLLEALVRNRGNVVSKAELSAQALGRKLGRFDRSIDVHVSALRQKLAQGSPGGAARVEAGAGPDDTPIATVRGQGYQWIID